MVAALGSFLGLACGDVGVESPPSSDRVAHVGGRIAWQPDDEIDEEECRRISDEANAYLDEAMQCSADGFCDTRFASELVDDACLPTLLCYVPISVGVDLETVAARLQELDREYREACGLCPIAMCIDPDRMFSTCDDSSCELNVAPPPVDALTHR
jgi:hypothetical protein